MRAKRCSNWYSYESLDKFTGNKSSKVPSTSCTASKNVRTYVYGGKICPHGDELTILLNDFTKAWGH